SSRHARIVRRDDGFFVIDLDSTNGTQVNGSPIAGETRVAPGDLVAFASSVFRFAGHPEP
ncbi:MAG: FHA domain-containing protein, partial [Planctomycetes bacterium]|nr:FHA domain-containing protein [Planctomycetota bacterium]